MKNNGKGFYDLSSEEFNEVLNSYLDTKDYFRQNRSPDKSNIATEKKMKKENKVSYKKLQMYASQINDEDIGKYITADSKRERQLLTIYEVFGKHNGNVMGFSLPLNEENAMKAVQGSYADFLNPKNSSINYNSYDYYALCQVMNNSSLLDEIKSDYTKNQLFMKAVNRVSAIAQNFADKTGKPYYKTYNLVIPEITEMVIKSEVERYIKGRPILIPGQEGKLNDDKSKIKSIASKSRASETKSLWSKIKEALIKGKDKGTKESDKDGRTI